MTLEVKNIINKDYKSFKDDDYKGFEILINEFIKHQQDFRNPPTE